MEKDKEEFMDVMSMQNNPKPDNYTTCLLDNDDTFLDGILSSEGIENSCISQQFGTSGQRGLNMKRQLPSQYWNEVGSFGKRFHGDLNSVESGCGNNNDQENHSFVSMLNQIPQHGTTFHSNYSSLLGSQGVDDGVLRSQFQLPTMN